VALALMVTLQVVCAGLGAARTRRKIVAGGGCGRSTDGVRSCKWGELVCALVARLLLQG